MRRLLVLSLLSLGLLSGSTAPASAQWWAYSNGWSNFSTWYSWYAWPGYYVDPVPARLYAAAEYRRSVADSYKVFMEAEVIRQDALQKRIDTYLKALDARRIGIREEPQQEVNWVENQIERKALLAALNPTDTEIKTGKALRALRHFLENHNTKLQPSASQEIPPECLKSVSFKIGRYEQGGSLHLIIGGKVAWYGILQDAVFEKDRQDFNDTLEKIVNQAKVSASVSQELHEHLLGLVGRMVATLEKNFPRVASPVHADRWYPGDYFAAERFLERELMRALWDLKRLSPEEFAAVTQTPNAQTVVQLLEQMRVKGMEFAPAQDKQVSSYYTLHRALANEVEKIRTFRPNASMN
jgi:hypothetical protein